MLTQRRNPAASIVIFSLLLVLTAVSCSKEQSFEIPHSSTTGTGNGDGGDSTVHVSLVGNYIFAGITAHTVSDVTTSVSGVSGRSVTTSDYTTTNNSGTVVIGSGKMTTKDISYDASFDATAEVYSNGVSTGPVTMPFSVSLPPTSSSSTYKLIGADSIYFDAGVIADAPDLTGTGATLPSSPAGGKYSFKGDTLFITLNLSQTMSQNVQGASVVIKEQGVSTSILVRQP